MVFLVTIKDGVILKSKQYDSEIDARERGKTWVYKASKANPHTNYRAELWRPQFTLENYHKGHRDRFDEYRQISDLIPGMKTEKDWFSRIGMTFTSEEICRSSG